MNSFVGGFIDDEKPKAKPIKFWKQVLITLFIPFGGIWAFSRVGKLKIGIILSVLPIAILYLPMLIMVGLDIESMDAVAIGSAIMVFGITMLIFAKFHYLYKFTKEHNERLEGKL